MTSTDMSLYEHEDSPVKFDFSHDDVDDMEKYDMEFYDDQFLHEDDPCLVSDANMSKIMEQLTFPHSAKEPELSADELLRLDALADQLELQRLERLQVLQGPDAVPPTSNVLSTRFVRTWREKHSSKGEAIWLRRSRFVAREFAWLEPERESLFSPASGSIISRVLPTVFLERREKENLVMASLDVRDAFLTVKQERTPWSIQQMQVEQLAVFLWGRCCLDNAMEACCGIVQSPVSSNQSLAWRNTPHILAF